MTETIFDHFLRELLSHNHTELSDIKYIDFDITYSDGIKEGRLQWNSEDGTLEVGMPGGSVTLQIGEEMLIRATNDQGAQINNGSLVRISGGTGNFPDVKLADKSSIATAGVVGYATEDIAIGQKGYITNFGLVRDTNTSGMAAGSLLWLGDDGAYTTTVPTAPDIKVIAGIVIREHATEGIVFVTTQNVPRLRGLSDVYSPTTPNNDDLIYWDGTNARWQVDSGGNIGGLSSVYAKLDLSNQPFKSGTNSATAFQVQQEDATPVITVDTINARFEILGDNVVNRISYPLSGISAFQQTLNIVVDGANIYMETNAVDTGTDLAYVFDEEKHTLDCTTGAGTAGKAQVALTVGTAIAPQINYVYVIPDGVGVATLSASTSLPTGIFAWHSIVVLQDTATVTAYGPISLQRTTEAVKHSGRGQLSYIREKLRWLGPKYVSGCTSTLDDGVAMNLSVSAGVVFQLHRQNFPALAVVADGITVANASGAGVLTELENIHDLNDIAEMADGSVIGVNKYFSVTIWATMASSDQNGNQSKLFVNLPTGVYNSESAVIADSSNFDVRTAADEFNNTAFLVSRVTFKKTSGDHTPVGAEVYSLTGSPMGTIGGGAGSTALTEFSDDAFHIYDNADPTKIVEFEASGIATGNTRIVSVQDAAMTIPSTAEHTDLTDGGDTILHDHDGISENTTARHTQGTDTALGGLSTYSPYPEDADKAIYRQVSLSEKLVTVTWLQQKTGLEAHFDSIYAAVSHAASHTDGTDDVQNATAAQKGLATAAQITKLDGISTGAEVNPDLVSQADAEAGTATDERIWSAERVKQAIDALGVAGSSNGWTSISDIWTRTGNHTFTVAGDVTVTYQKGTKIRYKDGGSYEYGVVLSSAYSSPNTTITLFTNSDYAMAAVTITDTAISYIDQPEGWVDWFDYTPTYSANGSMTYLSVTTDVARFRVSGTTVWFEHRAYGTVGGTLNTRLRITAPCAVVAAGFNGVFVSTIVNGSTYLGRGTIEPGTNALAHDPVSGNWTAGTNRYIIGAGFYEY